MSVSKVQEQKYRTPRKIQNRKSLIKWQNQQLKGIKRMENNCHIQDLVHAFPCVEHCGLNPVV